jgi:hypothetical protein
MDLFRSPSFQPEKHDDKSLFLFLHLSPLTDFVNSPGVHSGSLHLEGVGCCLTKRWLYCSFDEILNSPISAWQFSEFDPILSQQIEKIAMNSLLQPPSKLNQIYREITKFYIAQIANAEAIAQSTANNYFRVKEIVN